MFESVVTWPHIFIMLKMHILKLEYNRSHVNFYWSIKHKYIIKLSFLENLNVLFNWILSFTREKEAYIFLRFVVLVPFRWFGVKETIISLRNQVRTTLMGCGKKFTILLHFELQFLRSSKTSFASTFSKGVVWI